VQLGQNISNVCMLICYMQGLFLVQYK